MENKSICKNLWCRATYSYEGDIPTGECKKCVSFNTDMSGGVTWKDKTYNEPRNDGKAHEIEIKTKYGFKS